MNPFEKIAYAKREHQIACTQIMVLSKQIKNYEQAKRRFPGNKQITKMISDCRKQLAFYSARKMGIESWFREVQESVEDKKKD